VRVEGPNVVILLLSQLGDVSTECTVAGFEPICFTLLTMKLVHFFDAN